MAKIDDIRAKLTQVNDATNALGESLSNIAADITRIKEDIGGGLTASEADAVITDLDSVISAVQGAADQAAGIAAETPETPPNP
jgi:methyl-accepting chemotaxis protein